MFTGCGFTFNSINYKTTYGLILANVETIEFKKIGGDLSMDFFRNRMSPKQIIINREYDERVSFEVEMVSIGEPLTSANFNTIVNNICNNYTYGTLKFESDFYNGYHMNCYFTNAEKVVYSGGIYGIKATCNLDSSFMWSDSNFNSVYTINGFVVNNTSSQKGYIYPKTIIRVNASGGTVTLTNSTDSGTRVTTITGCVANEVLTITTNPYKITSNLRSNVYANFNKVFPRLVSGNNTFVKSYNITNVTINYELARSVM